MYTGYSFQPWINKSSISSGKSILEYSDATSRKYGIDQNITYNASVKRAKWNEAQHYWQIEYTRDGVELKLRCRFLFLCTGKAFLRKKSNYNLSVQVTIAMSLRILLSFKEARVSTVKLCILSFGPMISITQIRRSS